MQGLLYQPHTSAGRVPTAAAYRFFVEQVAAQATASPEDRQWIRRRTGSGADAGSGDGAREPRSGSRLARAREFLFRRRWRGAWWSICGFCCLPDGRVLIVLVSGGGRDARQIDSAGADVPPGRPGPYRGLFEPALHRLDARGHARGSSQAARHKTASNTAAWRMTRCCCATRAF
jgi:hypothetical protein